jgi:hypothetical protein
MKTYRQLRPSKSVWPPRFPCQQWASRLGHLLRDSSGQTVVLAAVLMPVFIAGIGYTAETGYWYTSQRELQHAADSAAYAGAVRKRAGDSQSGIYNAALDAAKEGGFPVSSGAIDVNSPPDTLPADLAAGTPAVEAILTRTMPSLFIEMFTGKPTVIRARAIALVEGDLLGCVLALSKTAHGAVTVTGSTSVTLDGCNVASNSVQPDSFLLSGASAAISTDCVYTVGEAVTTIKLTLNECDEPKEFSAPILDPYANLATPTVPTTNCHDKNVNNGTDLTPVDSHSSGMPVMYFCNGLTASGAVTFGAGLYVIKGGPFTTTGNTTLSGSNVTFYIEKTASMGFNGNVSVNFSAPTSGAYSGVLFFGDRLTPAATVQKLNGGSNSSFNGAIYFPSASLNYTGNSKSLGGCTQLIANTITFEGNSTVKASCQNSGTEALLLNEVRLAY